MKKRAWAWPFRRASTGVAGACIAMLAGCGGGGDGGAPPAPPPGVAAAPAPAGGPGAGSEGGVTSRPEAGQGGENGQGGEGGEGHPEPPLVQAKCAMDSTVEPSYEERRLPNKLASSDALSFSQQLLKASGFDTFGPDFAKKLCTDGLAGASSYEAALVLAKDEGARLWQAAVDRVQGRAVQGTLAQSDDRMLYWARLTMTLALRQWKPDFELSAEQRAKLQYEFERASRGQYSIDFPEGAEFKRVLVSGFDPFSLGEPGKDKELTIRYGNPSGATVLSLDGHQMKLADGSTAVIRTFLLPVNYGPFIDGVQEDTLGPWFKPGSKQVNASVTMSQGGTTFDLERYNGRYHFATSSGNDSLYPPCPAPGHFPAADECSINPPERWLGYSPKPWRHDAPPQFVEATLPFKSLIDARTGEGISSPSFQEWWRYEPPITNGWTVRMNESYSVQKCTDQPASPFDLPCANAGSGSNYLSNASAYRNTLLRDVMKLSIPAGHIHTPIMNMFGAGSDGQITDSTFERRRDAIVTQARRLVFALSDSLATPATAN